MLARGDARSVSETALARAQPAATALRLEAAAGTGTRLAPEGIAGGVHVARGRERRRRGRTDAWTGRRPRGRPVLGVVDAQPAATEVETIEAANGIGGDRIGLEFGERESAGATGFAIRADVDTNDAADLGEHLREVLLRRVETQITNENLGRNNSLLWW